ncbi:MAG: TRAP transporter substrate-binding protein DctP [Betaproteobacteria bacterium]|nr:TRAP transporter substrate-binding protein DctP [Betaproteobacteria bacterium]
MIYRYGRAAGLILALGLTLFSGVAGSQDKKIVLRLAHNLPVNHFLVEPLVKYWMDAVAKNAGGMVQFEYYPAEQLGKAKDMLSLALSGVTDIALVVPAYVSDKMPLSVVAELPGSFGTSCAGTFALLPLTREGGVIAAREYAPLGFRPLFSIVLPPYQIFSRHKLESVKSLEGLKLQTTGGPKESMIRKLKAVPIRMTGPEIYESLSRGTIDGGTLATGSILSYNLPGQAKFVTAGENFGSVVAIFGIGEARFKKLSDSVQKIMLEAGEAAGGNACAVVDKGVEADYEKLKQGGMTVVSFPPADRKEIAALAVTVRAEWADALDKRGKPGSEVLKAFTEALVAGR